MSRFGRVTRRPDDWATPHDRARSRAAERLDAELDPGEAAWLDEHLAGCEACRAVAEAYVADRLALRSLRDIAPEPPRDLWARTAAGIEREAGHGRAGRAGSPSRRLPLGAISGIAVIAIVLGATALSGAWNIGTPGVDTANASPSGNGQPGATPMLVAAGAVGWVRTLDDGAYAYNVADLDEVCPAGDRPDCAALDDQAFERLDLAAAPKSVIGSPTDGRAIVVGQDASGRQSIFVVSLPKAGTESQPPRATPKPSRTPTPTKTAAATPVETASTTPSESAVPTESPATTPEAATSPGPTDEPVETPEPTATTEPSPIVTPVPTPSTLETPSPEPTVALNLAIASGVSVVGESAAFSADGKWFAFTARPADKTDGPDIYVWRVGDELSRRLTTDGRSVFASWHGDSIIGSGLASGDPVDGAHTPVSFRVDPTSGERTDVSSGLWRPAVDPKGTFAIAWDGSVRVPATDAVEMVPGRGDLRIVRWPADGSDAGTTGDPIPGIAGPVGDFDVRWDETGSWVAIWTSEPADPGIGRLTLLRLDRESGKLTRPEGAPTEVPALSGFSIGNGRLAWVTPHGQDAEGSKVQVVAWSDDGVGATESVPGEDVVVVR
jgi:hypothetical protein